MLGTFNISGGVTNTRKKNRLKTRTIELEPIHTPQRQLIQLITSYLLSYPDRVFFVDDVTTDREWFRAENIKTVPREIVFLDLPSKDEADSYDIPRTMLIPMAVEFVSGRIETLYDQLDAPKRTSSSWSTYIENYSPRKAVQVVEEATKGKEKVEWINYRVPISNNKTARLHFEPKGEYNTGTFAFNLIHMGWKHGLRLIGTVQSERTV